MAAVRQRRLNHRSSSWRAANPIAAAFCMFNRYVDGLATLAPDDPEVYAHHARDIVEHGYRA
jgi:hypothetical protein